MFLAFINYYSQYLALQIRLHASYNSLQSTESPFIPVFTLFLDFVLAFLISIEEFNFLISVICKFSKDIIFIKGIDTWLVKQWAYTFFKYSDLVHWRLLNKLITDHNPKFLNRFWTALFIKLGVKLLYSIAYHPQPDRSSKYINQIVEIVLYLFVHALEDMSYWLKVLLHI